MRHCTFPIVRQFPPMLKGPLKHQRYDPFGQSTLDEFQVDYRKHTSLTAVLCVKVGHAVLFVIDSDYDSEEPTDFGHMR